MSVFSHKKKNELFEFPEDDTVPSDLSEDPVKAAPSVPPAAAPKKEPVSDEPDSGEAPDGENTGENDPLASLRRRMMNGAAKVTQGNPPGMPESGFPEISFPEPEEPEKPAEAPVPEARASAADEAGAEPPADFAERFADSRDSGGVPEQSAGGGEAEAPAEPQSHLMKKERTVFPKLRRKSLLEKCMPYITDNEGNAVPLKEKPSYRLESVEEILRGKSDRTIDTLSKKFDVTLDDLGRPQPEKPDGTAPADTAVKSDDKSAPAASVLPGPDAEPGDTAPEVYEDFLPESEMEGSPLPDLSDIDNAVLPKEKPAGTASADTATIRFTPVRDGGSSQDRISVSTLTRPLDLTGELGDLSLPDAEEAVETKLEETEFEDFTPPEEYNGPDDAKPLLRKLSLRKRRRFLQTAGSGLMMLILAAFELPFAADFLLRDTPVAMTVCAALVGASLLINFDLFSGFGKIFRLRSPTDANAALAGLGVLGLGIFSALNDENNYELLLLGSVILFFRALGRFLESAALAGNFRQVVSPYPKKAVTLLSDPATTFAMARNAVEGDALIAAPRSAETIADFMKHSFYSTVLGGKLRFVTLASVVLAPVSGFAAAAYFNNLSAGVYTAAAVLCLFALPPLFLIDTLPDAQAAKRLNRKGAMIAGRAAAERLELANAVVLSADQIFPDGTVTLHNMKVLSENNFDETILRAASLTDAAGSPLAAIFKRIAGTNAAYTVPDSDTVKYEHTQGISGWVDDELLLIGNRTLMEAHGISVPSLELDHKILRRGFFPVYLASGGKACALLVVQYRVSPGVVHELQQLTGMGVTVLLESCDPNMTEEMVCDYFGLYTDSVRVMSNAGVHMYRNAVAPAKNCSAPAAFRGNPLNIISILNCASRIKRADLLLTVVYVLALCAGTILFAYLSFAGAGAPMQGGTVLIYGLASAAAALLLDFAAKP